MPTINTIARMPKRYLSLAVALTVIAIPAASAQEDGTPQFEERIEVTEVTLDVQVTDKQGNAVLGLGPEDFIVEENGEPVEVLSATSYSSRYVADSERQPDSRFIVLVVHTPIAAEVERPGMVRERLQLGRDLSEWIEDGPAPSDWIAVASYKSSLKILQDFTQDRELLQAAVGKAGMGKEPRRAMWSDDSNDPFSLTADLPRGKQMLKESTTIYDALGLLADASGRIIGRKVMVLFSPGFGEFENSIRLANADRRYYDDLLARLSDNNVAVYPVDTTPVHFEHPQKAMLQQIASDTGGDFAPYVTRYGSRMADIADSTVVYYLLAYRVEHEPKDRGQRKVKVTTTNPDFEVVTRVGYTWEPDRK